jgi:hypothetical protein
VKFQLLTFAAALGLASTAAAQGTQTMQVRGYGAHAELINEDPCGFGHTMVFANDSVAHFGPGAPVNAQEVFVDHFRVDLCEGYEQWGWGWTNAANLEFNSLNTATLSASFEMFVERFNFGGGFPGEPPPPFPEDEPFNEPLPDEEPPPPGDAPEGWICPPEFFGSADGCDCGCGIPDPDCIEPFIEFCEFPGSCGDIGNVNPEDTTQCLDEPPPPPPPPPPPAIVFVELDLTWVGTGDTYRGMSFSRFSSRSGHYMSRHNGSHREADPVGTIVIDGALQPASVTFGNIHKSAGNEVFSVTLY